ncbi:216_t:CDS:2 [Cetraspora pellucida]|uniref:216_t:CDS:1 n=1 Tax=Cetraspora pellucida TaxID=1433469 RepID=A0A9N9AMG0_9GLOM|nr:216_t:CDS:2 [Cetraspora pellucida]
MTTIFELNIDHLSILRSNSNQIGSVNSPIDNEQTNSKVKMINWSLILLSISFLLIWFQFLENKSSSVLGDSLLVFILKALLFTVTSFIITIDNDIKLTNEVTRTNLGNKVETTVTSV